MKTVPFAPAHLDAAAALEKLCFSAPHSRQMLADELADPACVLIAAVDDSGAPAGYAGMKFVLDEGYIGNVAVFPAYRRQGVGRLLMAALDTAAVERGLCFLTLEVRSKNTAAIALYEACGYQREGLRRNYYSLPPDDAYLYTKRYLSV